LLIKNQAPNMKVDPASEEEDDSEAFLSAALAFSDVFGFSFEAANLQFLQLHIRSPFMAAYELAARFFLAGCPLLRTFYLSSSSKLGRVRYVHTLDSGNGSLLLLSFSHSLYLSSKYSFLK